jgi:hypothetical protein
MHPHAAHSDAIDHHQQTRRVCHSSEPTGLPASCAPILTCLCIPLPAPSYGHITK